MKNLPIRIMTDSVADIPPHLVEALQIKVVPIYLIMGQNSYLVDGAGNYTWFYETIMQSETSLRTASPSPEKFLQIYRELVDEGAQEIIGLFASANVSSLYNHARIAAHGLTDVRVTLIDTGQISMGIGWLVLLAAEAAARGATRHEIEKLVESARPRTMVFGLLDSTEYLRRSGRVSWATTQLVTLLQIKPLIAFAEGEARLIARMRTPQRAIQHLIAMVKEMGPLERLAVLHAHADPEVVNHLWEALTPCVPENPPPVIEVGPIFGAHVGPRAVGVALVRASENTF